MRNVLLIAKREYLEQVRGRSFRFSTVLVPLLVAMLIGANFALARHANSGKHIAIAATDPKLANAIQSDLLGDKKAGFTVDVVAPASSAEVAALRDEVRNNAIDGLLTIDSTKADSPKISFLSLSNGDVELVGRLNYTVRTVLARQQLLKDGMSHADIDRLFKEVTIDTLRIDKQDKVVKGSGMATLAMVNVMLLLILMPILLHGMDMARAIIEEKSSRIYEVMLAVVRPEESLTGKLLGTGAVGLTQIVIWAAMGAFASGSVALDSMMGGNLEFHISLSEIVFFAVYFVLGFLLYSAVFSGLGATCETAQDLQMYASLVVIPVWLALFAVMNLIHHPGSPWNLASSLFPVTSPFVMVPRLSIEAVPMWQTAASLAILVLSIWIALRLSARLYRVGILMYGKRATLPEILRWLRSA
ncbi:MAG: ABC transporter permease [Terracidiphilus sp.]